MQNVSAHPRPAKAGHQRLLLNKLSPGPFRPQADVRNGSSTTTHSSRMPVLASNPTLHRAGSCPRPRALCGLQPARAHSPVSSCVYVKNGQRISKRIGVTVQHAVWRALMRYLESGGKGPSLACYVSPSELHCVAVLMEPGQSLLVSPDAHSSAPPPAMVARSRLLQQAPPRLRSRCAEPPPWPPSGDGDGALPTSHSLQSLPS